ncbi:response regulator transcription factor [Herbiconiux sp. CPCC 205716]|uniref:Response regulator transcription factor n=1 Tax=Herbiconiux gentiana TaxID=2970912 RepID=A0ABT2GER0_9MICO|nr:response regulator transcription factor [Herbiconiux gentiana]MCS5713775.1 response regulator transcription factor [Herbiconiux gentiana]
MDGRVHTVGIVDDHELILDSLTGWLRQNAPELDVVAHSTGWVDMARHPAFPPDVVLMDLQLKEPISVEARIRICRSVGASVVVLSALDNPDNVRRVLAAGAAAFVSKSQPADELLAVVRRVLGVRPGAGAVTEAVAWDEAARPTRDASPGIRFSEHEEETLRLYASGHSPVEVAMILGTNIQIVKNALERVREQYASEGRQAERKQDLMLRAAEDGYLA